MMISFDERKLDDEAQYRYIELMRKKQLLINRQKKSVACEREKLKEIKRTPVLDIEPLWELYGL